MQKQQPIQWSIRCAQDDESWGDADFGKDEQQQRQQQPQIPYGNDKLNKVI